MHAHIYTHAQTQGHKHPYTQIHTQEHIPSPVELRRLLSVVDGDVDSDVDGETSSILRSNNISRGPEMQSISLTIRLPLRL